MTRTPGPRLTISQAASYAGVTTRAIRHYHQLGLVDEPPRDGSGYRRYSARDVIDLIRIRSLAQAGVPLRRVGALLAADRDEFAAAVAEIDEQLRAEIRRLESHRTAIAQLATVDGLALPSEVVEYLDMLRDLGMSERVVALERDAWVIVSAQLPDDVRNWIATKRMTFEDPQVVAIYHALDEAFDLPPGDPRLEAIADQLADLFARSLPNPTIDARRQEPVDSTTVAMLDAETVERSPAWRHLGRLLEQRGWKGWSGVEPPEYVPPDADPG
jgi:DNA-binding transcriptional MerR regulator